MGLGKLFNRSVTYEATNTVTGESQTFTIIGDSPLAPDWPSSSYKNAVTIPGAWRAGNLIADIIGGVPWHAYRERGDRPLEKISPTPPLLEQPHPPDPRVTTMSSWALDLVFHGNAIGVIAARNREGWPTAVVPVPADQVAIRQTPVAGLSSLPVGPLEYRIGMLVYGADDILHVKGPCSPGALRGMGVLEAHLATLQLATDQRRQARSISEHGVPTGLLKSQNPDLTKAEADELKDKWLKSQRDRTVAVLNATTEFTPLSWNPEELQLIEARKFTLQELSLIFGLPASFLNVEQASRTYSNIEQEGLNLLKFSLGGHLARFEQALTLSFPRGTWVKANLDSLLRPDTLTRYQAHQIGLDAGF